MAAYHGSVLCLCVPFSLCVRGAGDGRVLERADRDTQDLPVSLLFLPPYILFSLPHIVTVVRLFLMRAILCLVEPFTLLASRLLWCVAL